MRGIALAGRLCVAVLVLASAIAVGAAPATGTAIAAPAGTGSTPDTPVAAVEAPAAPPVNNTTHHRDPETVGESGDLADVERWLGGRMGELLESSTLRLSQGEYEQARALVGDRYDAHLSRYVDVAGETNAETDDHADTYRRTRRTQASYVATVERYREQREAYRTAKANGESERARRLARNLSQTADRLQTLSGNLTAQYDAIESFSDTDLEPATERVRAITENVTAETADIVAREFVRTELTATATSDPVSFTDPLLLRGTVEAADDQVESGVVVVRLGPQVRRVDVGSDGSFTATLRPTLAPVGPQNATVRYVPEENSTYLGSNTTVGVSVASVTPTVTVSTADRPLRYGDTLHVTASVAVNGTPVDGVPVALRFDGRPVARAASDGEGRVTATIEVPASVPAGTRSVGALLPVEGRAVATATANTTVRVVESETNLTLTQRDSTAVGRLTTDAGRPVVEQPVTVRVDGAARTVETNATGGFRLALPASTDAARSVEVVAQYDGRGTNLESATAATTMTLQAREGPGGTGGQVGGASGPLGFATPLQLGAGLVVLVALLVAAGWYIRREPSPERTGSGVTDEARADRVDAVGGGPAGSSDEPAFSAVRSLLGAGRPTDAVRALYPELRERLPGGPGDEARTHWEYHDAITARHPDAAATLQRVTEAYEQAAFAPAGVDDATAEDALTAAETILETVESGVDSGDADAGDSPGDADAGAAGGPGGTDGTDRA